MRIMPPKMEIVVGTYEQFLLGYKIDKIVNEYKMKQTFVTHSHIASIRSVASNKHYLVSGGADDIVCLYDMRHRTENGKLMHHNDSVNCVTFTPDASHIITGSNDGSIGVIRCGNWELEKLWQKPHKGMAVEALAVHPSGKLALSTGGDGVLRTWNLVKGKLAYATNLVPRWKNLAKYINILKWSPDGEQYLVAYNKKIDVYSVKTAGIVVEIEFDSKIICIEFLYDDIIAIGFEDGKIALFSFDEKSDTLEVEAHNSRLKCMQHFDDLLVTASSSGEIKLWRFTKESLTLLSSVTCNSRILCLTLASLSENTEFKKDEDEVKEVAPVKKINRLRMRQEVIIEDEEEELLKGQNLRKKSIMRERDSVEDSFIKNIRIKKKRRRMLDDFNVEDAEKDDKRCGLKRFSEEESEADTPVKKRIKRADFSWKKRKDVAWIEESLVTPPTKKKKKKKKEASPVSAVGEDDVKRKEKKRKITLNESLPNKKFKSIVKSCKKTSRKTTR